MKTTSLLAFLLFCVPAMAGPLTIVQTVGGDEGEVFLHQPEWPCYAPDGSLYLLNSGECQVLHLDPDWEPIAVFGRCGGGPGEFENPTGMTLYRGQVWVFEQARITVFAADGTYVRTLVPGSQYGASVVIGDRLVTRLGAGQRTVAYLDDEGVVTEAFGPECPADFFEAFKLCRNVQILPHEGGRCLLVNLVDGRATLVGDDGLPAWDRELVRTEDDSQMSTSEDGESVSLSLSYSLGMGMRDSHGRYWIVKMPVDEEAPMRVVVLDGDLEKVRAEFALPDGIYAWQLAETPDGRILLISTGESTIYVCELDEGALEG